MRGGEFGRVETRSAPGGCHRPGRLWETRHKPSLARLHDRLRITAVYDQVYRRAEIEADQLDCAACEGLAALVERPDVDVIYLLSPQWFGLHPPIWRVRRARPFIVGCPWPETRLSWNR